MRRPRRRLRGNQGADRGYRPTGSRLVASTYLEVVRLALHGRRLQVVAVRHGAEDIDAVVHVRVHGRLLRAERQVARADDGRRREKESLGRPSKAPGRARQLRRRAANRRAGAHNAHVGGGSMGARDGGGGGRGRRGRGRGHRHCQREGRGKSREGGKCCATAEHQDRAMRGRADAGR